MQYYIVQNIVQIISRRIAIVPDQIEISCIAYQHIENQRTLQIILEYNITSHNILQTILREIIIFVNQNESTVTKRCKLVNLQKVNKLEIKKSSLLLICLIYLLISI